MAFVKVARVADLPLDTTMEVTVDGRVYALCNAGGTVTAIDGLCPHHGAPLGYGSVENGFVACPWHLWEFDCRTGECGRDPGIRLATYPVRIEGGDIFIEIPEANA